MRVAKLGFSLIVALGGLGLAVPADAAPTAPPIAPHGTPPGTLAWGPCEPDVDAAFQCATLLVPLDYANPTGQQLSIALIRLPATGPRQGAVLFNPGGPGGSGYDFAANAGSAVQSSLPGMANFDMVGFDPRGVARSSPIECMTDAEVDRYAYPDYTPDTPEEEALLLEDQVFNAACRARYGDTLRHYSTANTARDMDAIRVALGDQQITYIGISYGTLLGGVYAALFPQNFRAMVLDSAYEPTGDTALQQWLTQTIGFEKAFNNFAAWCEETADCAFAAVDVGARWDTLYGNLDAAPVPAADGRFANQAVLEVATVSALYNDLVWPSLAKALLAAEQGSGTELLRLADSYMGREPDGSYDNSNQAGTVIRCASDLDYSVPDDPAALLALMQQVAPRFARSGRVEDLQTNTCDDLVGPNPEVVAPQYSGTAPITVIGGINDPATPFRWAEELTARMGPSATLVTYTGEGHGYLLAADCIDTVYTSTLINLTVPAAGTVCEPNPLIAQPIWWPSLPATAPGMGGPIADPSIDLAFGLDPRSYFSGSWLYAGDTPTMIAGYQLAAQAAGFTVLNQNELDGIASLAMRPPGGDAMIAVALFLSPETIASDDDFIDLRTVVPAGSGVIVVAAFVP